MTTKKPLDKEIVSPFLIIDVQGTDVVYPARLPIVIKEQIADKIADLLAQAALDGKLLPYGVDARITSVEVIENKARHTRQVAYDGERLCEDDLYIGPRWTYALRIRPLAQYNVPDGWIIGSGKDRNFTPYGTVDYPFPLTKEQQDHYSMTPVLRCINVHPKEGHPQMEVWTDHTKSVDAYLKCYATYGEFTGWLQAEGYEYVTEDGFIVVLGKGDDCLSTHSHEPRNCLTYDYGEMPLYDVSAWNFVNVEDKE